MELESLFSSTRWEILKALSKKSYSPIELSELLNTTPANISQQLRLLELAGLVASERASTAERGKPRVLYSLANNFSYLILTSKSFADKRLLPLTTYHNFILKSWFLDNVEHHTIISKFYWELEPYLDYIRSVVLNLSKRELEIIVIADEPEKVKITSKEVRTTILTSNEFSNLNLSKYELHVLYDPEQLVLGKKRDKR
ncbi:winged helix-turn-helix transcriptional regulator [Candidatus Woesearchaeota archaeon]|nr:winged helix-turn-helix transcriptional regulator [Candidatus Woesearchaeota archaeon]